MFGRFCKWNKVKASINNQNWKQDKRNLQLAELVLNQRALILRCGGQLHELCANAACVISCLAEGGSNGGEVN